MLRTASSRKGRALWTGITTLTVWSLEREAMAALRCELSSDALETQESTRARRRGFNSHRGSIRRSSTSSTSLDLAERNLADPTRQRAALKRAAKVLFCKRELTPPRSA